MPARRARRLLSLTCQGGAALAARPTPRSPQLAKAAGIGRARARARRARMGRGFRRALRGLQGARRGRAPGAPLLARLLWGLRGAVRLEGKRGKKPSLRGSPSPSDRGPATFAARSLLLRI